MAKQTPEKKAEVVRPLSYSWTKINDYLSCPFLFKSKHIDKRVPEVNPLMIVGRVTHNAINIYNKHCFAKKLEHDFPAWKECAYLALEQENLDPEHYPDVLDMVKGYAESHKIDLDCAIGAEEQLAVTRDFKETEWDASDVWFRAALDYLQIAGDVCKLTDYKSGWLLNAPKFQFRIYAFLVKKRYPQIKRFEIEIDFTRHEYQERFVILEDEIEDIGREIMSKINMIEKDDKFEPTLGNACSFCGCWRWCPAMKKEDINFVLPGDEGGAKTLAVKIEQYTKLLNEAKKVMKLYCNEHGDVVAGNKRYGFTVSRQLVFKDVVSFIAKADGIGVDVYDCLSVNNLKLKKKFYNNEEFQKLVEEISEKKLVVTFKAKKEKVKEDVAPNVDDSDGDEG